MKQSKFYQIKNITEHEYTLVGCDGSVITLPIQDVDKSASAFTIKDAKDGDVLACDDNIADCPFIFHNLTKELNPRSYCGVNTAGHFQDNDENGGHWCYSNEVRPATKEQCDLLFQKMKEAGYMWDAEKKELKIKLKEPDIYEYELERIVDKLNEVIGKLGDLYEVLSKPYVFPYRDYTSPSSIPGMDVWYKTHGVEKVPPVTCETLNSIETDNGKDNDKERTN